MAIKALSILIPTYNDLCVNLVDALRQQAEAADFAYEILVADDGSTDADVIARNSGINQWEHCQYLRQPKNIGRAAIRNYLAQTAQYDWLLFIDSDMTLAEFTSTLDNPNGIISSDKVGPTIANDMKRDAIIAVIIALFVIFAYIAFRFKGWTWGLGGVVSLAHTAIIIIGFFSLFTGILPFNLDVDQTFIAAILTIIGYAINDNVVIFDRIREMKGLHPKDDFKDTVNRALNATLTRTVNTSVSTLLPMLAIAFFGGESIRGLSVALCLGILIGTYASIMIGTPVMYDATMKAQANKK